MGRVLTRTLPLGQQESFTYDSVGRQKTHTDFTGVTTTFTYNVNDQLELVTYQDGSTESYQYDVLGNRLSATDASGTTDYTYDLMNRLQSETKPTGEVLAYQYDNNGNKTQLKLTRGTTETTTDYTYDALNRLKTVTDAQGQTSYTYDAVGNLDTVTFPNGIVTDYDYNTVNQLINVTTKNSLGDVLSSYTYGLDNTGRRDDITEANGRYTDYVYDTLYRLTDEIVTDAINGDYSANYQYDKVGNRTYETVDGVQTAFVYDANDRLTSQGGTVYSYDDNGNTLTETQDGDTTSYSYDERNKLLSVTKAGVTTEYTYNHNGIRTSKTEGGVTTHFVVDENRDYAQVLEEVVNNATTVSYSYGHDLLSQNRSGEFRFYHYDGLGSTRGLSDTTGSLTDTYNYEAFGEVLNQTGSTENTYLFTGEQFDSSLDQYYLRARYYDQGIGRFTQQDTWMGNNHDPVTLHKYLYANADPVTYTDPSGYFSMAEHAVAMNVAGVLTNLQTQGGLDLLGAGFGATGQAGAQETVQNTQLALGIASLGVGGFQIAKLLSKKIRSCAPNSFSEDTLVSTESGLKKISDVQVGEKVWSFNEETGENSLQKVIHLINSEGSKELIDIQVTTGEVITATAGHPFYVPEIKKWVTAGELNPNNYLLGLNGDLFDIAAIKPYGGDIKVYNLTVASNHTYYVGESGLLSHNCKPVGSFNMRHIMSGDRFGGGHSIHGNAINVLEEVSPRLSNGVYRAKVRNPVDGVLDVKTFFPDSWDSQKIKTMINLAYTKQIIRGGSVDDFTQWVKDGDKLVQLRVMTRANGNAVEVLTAHPIYGVHP